MVQAAFTVLKDADPDDPVTAEQIREAIREAIEKEPNARRDQPGRRRGWPWWAGRSPVSG